MESRKLFPSTLYSERVADDEWRVALREDIFAWRDSHPETTVRSSYGGSWHSPVKAHERAAFKPLLKEVVAAATTVFRRERYLGNSRARLDSMWANVNPAGAYHVPHTHGEALWAGVYYVETPPKSPGIVFMDPRFGVGHNRPHFATGLENDRFKLDVSAGDLIFFPAWLLHYVEPHTGDDPRISVSFNVRQVMSPPQPKLPNRKSGEPNFVCVPNVLSGDDCRALISHASGKWDAARVGGGEANPDVRDSDVVFVNGRHDGWFGVYRKIFAAGEKANYEHFGLDISGGIQPQQVTRYGAGQFYGTHLDLGEKFPTRTLSCVITLQNAELGGGTSFPDAPSPLPAQHPGDAVFFRADERHAADKVEAGERLALVGWFERAPR